MEKESTNPKKVKAASRALKKAIAEEIVIPPSCPYSLSLDKEIKRKEVVSLKKQYDLAEKLILEAKDSTKNVKLDETQKSQLIKKQENCESKKIVLLEAISAIERVQFIIDCSLKYFYFVEQCYKFSISRQIEVVNEREEFYGERLKKLRKDESLFIDSIARSDFLLSTLKVLNLEIYQSYLETYSATFSINATISNSDADYEYYNECFFLARKIYAIFIPYHFYTDEHCFDLEYIKNFFQHSFAGISLPTDPYYLIGLWAFTSYTILTKFIEYKPVSSNFKHFLQLNTVAETHFYKNINTVSQLCNFEKKLGKLKNELDKFQSEAFNFTKNNMSKALFFYKFLQEEVASIRKTLSSFLENEENRKMSELLLIVLSEEKLPELQKIFTHKVGLVLPFKNIPYEKGLYNRKNGIEALQYFFYFAITDEQRRDLYKKIKSLISNLSIDEADISSISLSQLSIDDFIALSHFLFYSLIFFEFNRELRNFEKKILSFKLQGLDNFLMLMLKDIDKRQILLIEKNNAFLENGPLNKFNFIKDKEDLLDEIMIFLAIVEDTLLLLEEFKRFRLKLGDSYNLVNFKIVLEGTQFFDFFKSDNNDFSGVLHYLENERASILLKKEEIEKRLLPVHSSKVKQFTEQMNTQAIDYLVVDGLEKSFTEFTKIFSAPLACLARNFFEGLSCIEKMGEDRSMNKKDNLLRQKFSSAIGQIRSSISRLIENLNTWQVFDVKEKTLDLTELLDKIKRITLILFDQKEDNTELILFKKNIDNCALAIKNTSDQIIKMINKNIIYNQKLEKLLKNYFSFYERAKPSFFSSEYEHEKREGKFSNDYLSLTKQFDGLEELIRVVRYRKDEDLIRLYDLVGDGNNYRDTLCFLKAEINLLRESALNKIENESKISKDKRVKKGINEKMNFKNKGDGNQAKFFMVTNKKEDEVTDNLLTLHNRESQLSRGDFTLLEQFKVWNDNFVTWKFKTNSQLLKLFHVVEQSSVRILNDTAHAFLRYLQFYNEELQGKKTEFDSCKIDIKCSFSGSNVERIFEDYLFQQEDWLNNNLTRIGACQQFIYQCIEKYNVINNEAIGSAVLQLKTLHPNQVAEFNSLLANYLEWVIQYNKTREQLNFEENKLFDLNSKFITNIIKAGSLEQMEGGGNLLSEFSAQLATVNQLNVDVGQQHENKQQIKARLASMVHPHILRFYMSRIDPCEAKDLEVNTFACSWTPMLTAHTMAPLGFYSIDSQLYSNLPENTVFYCPTFS